jgi:hypothetical protein
MNAVALFRNERAITALVRIEHDQDCEVGTVLCRYPSVVSGGVAIEPAPQQEGWHVIASESEAGINVI